MSGPLDFLKRFAGELRASGVRFAITSGMACVHYGLQQTTKDSDWIVAPENLESFRALLNRLESRTPPWRISYRAIFGAPLELRKALGRAVVKAQSTLAVLALVQPPIHELLP